MSIDLKMPALSPTMESGTLSKWLVRVGDVVKPGDLVAEIETDKATMELESVDAGRISEIVIPDATDNIAVGTVIARIEQCTEPASRAIDDCSLIASTASSPEPIIADDALRAGPVQKEMPILPEAEAPMRSPASQTRKPADQTIVSPLAARIAYAMAIDTSNVVGTGAGGRIIKADLQLAAPATLLIPFSRSDCAEQPAVVETHHPIPDIPHDVVRLSNMRKTIARRLSDSKRHIPHIYLTIDVQLDALLTLRTEINEALAPRGIRISINDMAIKALALALAEVPACNVQFAGDQMVRFTRVDIAFAVAVPDGLITPVIPGLDRMAVSEIASKTKELATRARTGQLRPEEYHGGTASISNLGMFGIMKFQAIINPPQAMILALGASEKRALVRGNEVTTGAVLSATGSFDHRAIDGADAAQLMQAFKGLIESPYRLIG